MKRSLSIFAALVVWGAPATRAQDWSKVEIKATKVGAASMCWKVLAETSASRSVPMES